MSALAELTRARTSIIESSVTSTRMSKTLHGEPLVTHEELTHEDQCAISRTLAGDRNAFNELALRYQNLAFSIAYRMLQSVDAARDAVQDSLIKAFRALPSCKNGQFKNWFIRIVINTCHDMIRINRRLILEEIADDSGYDLTGEHSGEYNGERGWRSPHQVVDCSESPQAFVERMELSAQIELGLHILPAEQRLALVLCDIHGYSYDEICEVTGSSKGTIKSRVSRARCKLREFLLRQQECLWN